MRAGVLVAPYAPPTLQLRGSFSILPRYPERLAENDASVGSRGNSNGNDARRVGVKGFGFWVGRPAGLRIRVPRSQCEPRSPG
jgi:hypothetical protein